MSQFCVRNASDSQLRLWGYGTWVRCRFVKSPSLVQEHPWYPDRVSLPDIPLFHRTNERTVFLPNSRSSREYFWFIDNNIVAEGAGFFSIQKQYIFIWIKTNTRFFTRFPLMVTVCFQYWNVFPLKYRCLPRIYRFWYDLYSSL
jgi:hypothetical protein